MNVGQSANKKAVLEELLDLGMVLVAIDARVPGVDVPAHLEVDPQLRLNLSYRFGRPMQVDAWGITADLTFGGVPHACRFPWDAIFLMVSHVNGEPYLFPDHVPQELIGQATGEFAAAAAATPSPATSRPKLSLVRTDADAAPADVEASDAGGAPADKGPAPEAHVRADTSVSPKLQPQATPLAAASAPAGDAPNKPAPEATPDAAKDAADAADAASERPPSAPTTRRGHLRLVK